MGLPENISAKAKTASKPAQGNDSGKSAPDANSVDFKPVTRNQNFTVKGLSFSKKSSGY